MRFSLTLLGLLSFSHIALAHDWYPLACCSGIDCHPIACEEINERKDGSMSWRGWVFPKEKIKMSQDVDCHACNPGGVNSENLEGVGICLFILPTA